MAKKKSGQIGRPKKQPQDAKSRYLQVRVQENERASFAAAAEMAGLDLSAWVRTRLRTIARKELTEFGKPIDFLEK